MAHGSTDQPVAARLAGTPQVTMFDYEYAAAMHHWNGRLATRVLVPAAIPEGALARYGIRPPKLVRYHGLKEEYYLADHAMDPGVLDELGLDAERLIVVVRPPPEVTLYHRGASTDLFAATLARLLGEAPAVQTVVLPRTDAQREALLGSAAIVPRAADRRAQPGGGRGPGGERRGHDEPRGRRARRAGLHALRRPPRRGRPQPHRGGPPAPPDEPGRHRAGAPRAGDVPPLRDPEHLVDLILEPAAD